MAITIQRSKSVRALLGLGVVGAIIVAGVPAVSAAAVTVGSVCPKLGAESKAGTIAVVCKDAGAQNVWTDKKVYPVSIQANAVVGGKNSAQAQWLAQYVIPNFTLEEAAKGKQVDVNFISSGADDASYKSQLALDLGAKKGPDVVNIDGFWVSEFADAGYIKPLNDVVGAKAVAAWSGWKQIPATINQVMTYNNKLYGVPAGTDGRGVGGGALRRGRLHGHGAVRALEAFVSARSFEVGAWPAEPRHLQPSVPPDRAGTVRGGLRQVHGRLRRNPQGGCGDRRQGSAPLVRPRQRQVAVAHGLRLGLRATPRAGAGRHRREVERNHRRAEIAGDAAAEWDDRDRRRAQLSARHRPADRRSGRRLRPRPEGKSGNAS